MHRWTSSPVMPKASTADFVFQKMFAWVVTAPFGTPVDPVV